MGAEALKSQAVAARSYALATRQVGAPFDVYSDTRSQMYLGLASEIARDELGPSMRRSAGALLQGHDRDDVILVDVGRQDGVEPGVDRNRAPVPRLGARSLRHHLAVPRLGPACRHRGDAREGAEGDRRHHRRDDVAGCKRARRATQLRHAVHAGQRAATKLRAAIGLRSTWFTVSVLSLAPPAPNVPVMAAPRDARRHDPRPHRRDARAEAGGRPVAVGRAGIEQRRRSCQTRAQHRLPPRDGDGRRGRSANQGRAGGDALVLSARRRSPVAYSHSSRRARRGPAAEPRSHDLDDRAVLPPSPPAAHSRCRVQLAAGATYRVTVVPRIRLRAGTTGAALVVR